MRKYAILVWMLAVWFFSCNGGAGGNNISSENKEEGPLDLEIKVKGLSEGYCKLLGIFGEQNYMVDSAMADANGNVVFKQDTNLAAGLYFVLFPNNKFIQLLLDKDQVLTLESDMNDLTGAMKVKGSLDNELFYKNLKFEQDITKKFEEVKAKMDKAEKDSEEYKKAEKEQNDLVKQREEHVQWFADNYPNSFFTQFKIAGQNPTLHKDLDEDTQIYAYRNEFWNGVDFTDARLLRTPVYHNKLKRYITELTPQVTDSLIKYADLITQKSMANKELFKYTANWIALQYQKTKVMGLEAVYVHMIDKYWTYDLAFWTDSSQIKGLRGEANAMKPSLIGKTGQDVRAKNENDQYISLYDIKKPITVVYIFSYECENCQKETPKLVKAYNELKDKMDVFTICLDHDKDQWKAYLKKNNVYGVWHNVFDWERESNYHRKYYVDITPEMYVLNRDHKIIASNINSEQLATVIDRELEKEKEKN